MLTFSFKCVFRSLFKYIHMDTVATQFYENPPESKQPWDKQEEKMAAVLAWHSINRDDTKCWLMSVGHRLKRNVTVLLCSV